MHCQWKIIFVHLYSRAKVPPIRFLDIDQEAIVLIFGQAFEYNLTTFKGDDALFGVAAGKYGYIFHVYGWVKRMIEDLPPGPKVRYL